MGEADGGSGRAAAALGARAQLLRGPHDALGRGALALHYGRVRLQGLHAARHATQAGGRAQPQQSVASAFPPRLPARPRDDAPAETAAAAASRLRQVRSVGLGRPLLVACLDNTCETISKLPN